MAVGPKPTTPDGNPENTAAWRKHFPIEAELEASRSRREFVGGLGVACGAMVCGQIALQNVAPPLADGGQESNGTEHEGEVLPKKLQEMTIGEAQLFHYPNEKSPCLLVKLDETEFVAFGQKCTHLCCPVIPEPSKDEFHCPCHHGTFDLKTGEPLAGPPRSALPKVKIEVASDGSLKPIRFG